MADGVQIRVDGLSEVLDDLDGLAGDLTDLDDGFANIAADGAAAGSRLVPRLTGALGASVEGVREKSKALVIFASVYAGPINYGWPERNIEASGFAKRTDEEMEPKSIQRLEADIESSIRKRGLR